MHLKGLGDEIIGYPNVGDMRAVRPSIRSMEGALHRLKADGTEERPNWSVEFWDRCLAETGCVPVALPASSWHSRRVSRIGRPTWRIHSFCGLSCR